MTTDFRDSTQEQCTQNTVLTFQNFLANQKFFADILRKKIRKYLFSNDHMNNTKKS